MLDTRFETKESINVDAQSLEEALKETIQGEVRFDNGSRGLYSTDGSNYRQIPIGVVIPTCEEDIIKTIALCAKYDAPVLSRGGGTSLAGQCCNVAVVMDTSKYYNRILHLDINDKLVRVQPGIVLDHLKAHTEKYDLTFGPDPSTHSHCTIGGMLGNNSCGVHSVMAANEGYGARMSDNTAYLTIITYDGVKMKVGPTSEEELENIIKEGGRKGEIYQQLKNIRDKYGDLIRKKFPQIPRRVSGYNLDELLPEKGFNVARALVGSEGTCVTILDATLKILPAPKAKSLLVLGYPDVYAAGHHVTKIMTYKPIGLEGIDDQLIEYMKQRGLNVKDLPLLPKGKGWLLVEFDGQDKNESDNKAKNLMEELKKEDNPPTMSLFDDPKQEEMLWEIRESGLGATAFVPNMKDTWPGWEDSAVPPEKVGDYLKDLRELFHKYGYEAALYGHFGQGCIHCRIDFDMVTHEGLEKYKKFTEEAAHLVINYGGSISGEHGDGQARGDLLEIMYGKELMEAFHAFKHAWDPRGKMNPGKIIDTYGELDNLRLGSDYKPATPKTYFRFPEDDGDFSRAVLRCVGVGNCRRSEGGTMCPSYMVTREEMDATRGRARLLFEMLQGDVITGGWKDEHVRESLDLCLACKGCKGDCPVNVDMATYKAEFLSHYYEGRLRPRPAYAFGYIYRWARMASIMPSVANFFTQTPLLSKAAKFVAGIAQERKIPPFANQTFRYWFKNHRAQQSHKQKKKVILWADTFNNFFLPETLVAGLEVLEAAGFEVVIPKQMLCCGRPLYDFGMLKTARNLLAEILQALSKEIQAGIPVVGLEPSCVAVFRDELCNLFPNNEDAKRLKKQTYTLAEFLEKEAPDFKIPKLKKKAVLHGHCHHKSIMKMDSEYKVLKDMGVEFETPELSCCGMAGYFGYEASSHYDFSIKAGEKALLPAIRKAEKDTLVVADGFSCREQIQQETDRKGLHLAQVIQMAMHDDQKTQDFPEKKYVDNMRLPSPEPTASKALVTGIAAGAAIGLFTMKLLKKLL